MIVPNDYNWNRSEESGEIVETLASAPDSWAVACGGGDKKLTIGAGVHLDADEQGDKLEFSPALQEFVGYTIKAYKVGNDGDETPVTTFVAPKEAAQGHEVTLTLSLRNPHGLNLFFEYLLKNKFYNKRNHHQVFLNVFYFFYHTHV